MQKAIQFSEFKIILIQEKNYKTDSKTLQFWLQPYFLLTRNSKELKNPSIERYLCIEKDVVFCILKSVFKSESYLLRIEMEIPDHVIRFLSKNLIQNTILPKKTSGKIDFTNQKLLFFNPKGQRFWFKIHKLLFWIHCKELSESISLMFSSLYFERAIFTALGIRKLDQDEVKLVKNQRFNSGCLYSKKVFDSEEIFTLGMYAGVSENYVEINDQSVLDFACKNRNSLFLRNGPNAPKGWIKITDFM